MGGLEIVMEDLEVETRTWRVGGPVTDGRFDVEAVTSWVADNAMTVALVVIALFAAYVLWRTVLRGGTPRY